MVMGQILRASFLWMLGSRLRMAIVISGSGQMSDLGHVNPPYCRFENVRNLVDDTPSEMIASTPIMLDRFSVQSFSPYFLFVKS
jgi:hypothetical protein